VGRNGDRNVKHALGRGEVERVRKSGGAKEREGGWTDGKGRMERSERMRDVTEGGGGRSDL